MTKIFGNGQGFMGLPKRKSKVIIFIFIITMIIVYVTARYLDLVSSFASLLVGISIIGWIYLK